MRIHEYLLDFFMALFALSSMALWGTLLFGGSFRTYAVIMLAVPMATAYLIMINSRGHTSPVPVETPHECYKTRFGIAYIVVPALLLVIFFSESSLLTVVLLLLIVFFFLRNTVNPPRYFTSFSAQETSPFILSAALVIAVSYTLVSHRTDADDALYLFFGLLPLDQPSSAMNLFPMYDSGRMLVSYPAIEAVVSYWTGINFLQVHYLIIPLLAAILCVLAYFGLFRRISGSHASILTLITVIILILWGDVHRSPGNFAFVRLFQGKAIFYSVVCPYLASSVIGVLNRRSGSNLRLAMASISGIGLTQSALVLAPLFFMGLIVATWLIYRELPTGARSLPFLAGLALFISLSTCIVAYLGKIPTVFNPRDYSLREALDLVFGDGLRGPFGIASIALLPLIAQNRAEYKAVIAIIVALMLIALNPFIVSFTGQFVSSLAWRLQWLLLPAATAATGIFLAAHLIARGKSPLCPLLCALGLAGFAMLGQTTFSAANGNQLGIPRIKPPPTVNGIFERHHNGRYKLHAEYRLEEGRICMENGCY